MSTETESKITDEWRERSSSGADDGPHIRRGDVYDGGDYVLLPRKRRPWPQRAVIAAAGLGLAYLLLAAARHMG